MRKVAIAIGTHPDDIEIGCGGSIALLIQAGYLVKFVIITSGEEGSLGDKSSLKVIRETEARNAATSLGVSEIYFLNEPDGLTTYSKATKVSLIKLLRATKPDTVFIHTSHDFFPDHMVAHNLSTAAILAASGPWYAEAGCDSHQVMQIYGYEVWNPIPKPQMLIDISSTIENKLAALGHHKSQIEGINYLDAVRGLNQYRGIMMSKTKYAEAFEVIKAGLTI